jgi:hypothetical protein
MFPGVRYACYKVNVAESVIFDSSQKPKLETIVLVVEHIILRLLAHSGQRKIICITIMVDTYDFDN